MNRQKPPTQGHRLALQPLSSVPWDQALTAPRGASYTTHFTPLPRSLELHHREMLPSSFWIKGNRVGVLHWSGKGWSSDIWGLERCKGCVKVCSRYSKPSWLSLGLMRVRVCVCDVSSGHGSRHPCLTRQQHGTQPGGGGHHHQGACSQVSVTPTGAESPKPLSPFLLTALSTSFVCFHSSSSLSVSFLSCLPVQC